MPAEILVTRDDLGQDAVFILQYLRESQREGRSTHMLDVRGFIASSVTLEFSDYLKFLRKFGYVTLDRDQHTLALTPEGDLAAQGDPAAHLLGELDEFFADKLKNGVVEIQSEEEERQNLAGLVSTARPPPPPEDLTPMPGPAPTFAALAGDLSVVPPAEDELFYVRGEPIGQGPHGVVYRARHATLGTDIAVKELRDAASRKFHQDPQELVQRLKTELSSQAKLKHPAIVGVHDLDLTVPQPFAVLELCGGGNLRAGLEGLRGVGLPPEDVMRAFAQLLAGLAFAHERGVVHHNLKAENILFDEMGNAKLGDFGFGRLYRIGSGEGPAFVDAAAVGYRAPELLQKGAAGPAADVYALGILFYEALTGNIPGRRSPLPSKVAPSLSEKIDDWFERMTADRPEERYETAAAALGDLWAAYPDGRYGSPGVAVVRTAAAPSAAAPKAGGPKSQKAVGRNQN